MKTIITLLIPCILFMSGFDKKIFYTSLYSNDLNLINQQLKVLESEKIIEKQAYEGAMLMKKAGLVNGNKQKLDLFRTGKLKLEAAIADQPKNIEYRFLRLLTQDNIPKFLAYNKNIQADYNFIISNINFCNDPLKKIIMDYLKIR